MKGEKGNIMRSLMYKIIDFKNQKNDDSFEKLEKNLRMKVVPFLNNIEKSFRDDVYQEILIKIIKLCDSFKILNYSEIKEQISYIDQLTIYLKQNNNIFKKDDFTLFFNQFLFERILNETIINVILDFFKSRYYREYNDFVSLNKIIYNDEFLEYIYDSNDYDISRDSKNDLLYSAISLLDEKDKDFVVWYYFSGQTLNQTDAAKKLNETQQNISKRLNRVYKKLRNIYINLASRS